MNIAIIGNSHFGSILAMQLNSFDKTNNYKFYNTNEKKIDKLKFILNILNIDIVYSVSASVSGGGALNFALKFNKKIVQHFIGSDVLSAIDDYKNNNLNKKLINHSTFLCEVDWIQNELKEINLRAKVTPIMVYENFIEPKEFSKFRVLTYMSKGKEQFYGIDDFVKLAQDFPQVSFAIAGIDNYPNLPKNIDTLGWIDMNTELQKSTIFIRNAKHDGLGFSVIEALALGRKVLYNYRFPYCNYFDDYYKMRNIIYNYYDKYENNQLSISKDAIEFVKTHFNKETVLKKLTKEILE